MYKNTMKSLLHIKMVHVGSIRNFFDCKKLTIQNIYHDIYG